MSVENKKRAAVVAYYTLILLALAMCAFFIYVLVIKDVAIWAKIIYFVWSGIFIGELIFDVICTCAEQAKIISAGIAYVLSILAIGMACLLYFLNAGSTGLATDFLSLFTSVSLISLMSSMYLVAAWCVGEVLVDKVVEREQMQK